MTNLAEKIDATHDLLREIASKTPEPPRETPAPLPPRRTHREPETLRASELLLTLPGIGDVLREHFKPVPAEYFEQHEDESRTVTCLCTAQATLAFGALHRCKCHRIFWNGATLKAAPAPEPTEVVICDGPCGDNLKLGEGRWVRIDGHELYCCEQCAQHSPGEVLQ